MRVGHLLAAMTLFILVDAIWILSIQSVYKDMITSIQNGQLFTLNAWAAMLVYAIMALCLVLLNDKYNMSPVDVGVIGSIVYGVYSFTNFALFRKWSLSLAITETLWGGILFFTTASLYRHSVST
jgi:uncharacterized membrane protein